MAGHDPCSLGEGKVIGSTEKALRFEPKNEDAFWVPRSVIHDDSEVYDEDKNSEGELFVKQWWAEKEGHA